MPFWRSVITYFTNVSFVIVYFNCNLICNCSFTCDGSCELFCVICVVMGCGHYTAYTYNTLSNQWHYCNDETVTQVKCWHHVATLWCSLISNNQTVIKTQHMCIYYSIKVTSVSTIWLLLSVLAIPWSKYGICGTKFTRISYKRTG